MEATKKDFSGFHRLNITERLQRVAEESGLSSSEQELLQNFGGLPSTTADGMVENVIGVIGVPLGIATNLLLDGRELLVPMATEESSVIAAVCNAAKQCTSACQTERQGWSCWRSTCLSGIPPRRGRSGAGTGAALRQQRKHSNRKAAQGCLP